MVEFITTDGKTENEALTQARALLQTMHEETPALSENLSQLEALLDAVADSASQHTLEESAQFTSIMAHELRIPMTSIRGYIDMIAKGHTGPLTDMQKQFAEVIQNNTLRMERLVSDVNDLSKLRAGQMRIDINMEMYSNLIMGVEKETKALAEEREQTITFDTPKGMPLLNLDSGRAKQALISIVNNALLYTPSGEGEISVVGSKQDGDALVTVTDNGIGMTAEELAKMGIPFWRGEDDLVRQHKGHGLGFAIAENLMRSMGGAILVESERGVGTTVRVTLPAMKMG